MRSRLVLLAPAAAALLVVLSRWATSGLAQPDAPAPPPAPTAIRPAEPAPTPTPAGDAVPTPTPAPASDAAPSGEAGPAPAPAPAQPAYSDYGGDGKPLKVYVGVYAFQVPQIALSESNYLVDFWVWFRWKGDFDPTTSFELLNQFEGDIVRTPIYIDAEGNARPDDLPDGSKYQVYRIQSRFGRSFDVSDYPFDDQALTIAFEDNNMTVDQMIYIADEGTELVDPGLRVEGWIIDHIKAEVTTHGYPTNWGDPRRPINTDRYSQFSYTIHLRRPVAGYLATTLVPIAIVMLINISVFFIGAANFAERLGLATTCMISAVALQLTAQADLPKTGQMVLLDHVYNLSYATILITLIGTIWTAHLHDREAHALVRKIDWAGLAITLIVFFGGTGALIASAW